MAQGDQVMQYRDVWAMPLTVGPGEARLMIT